MLITSAQLKLITIAYGQLLDNTVISFTYSEVTIIAVHKLIVPWERTLNFFDFNLPAMIFLATI